MYIRKGFSALLDKRAEELLAELTIFGLLIDPSEARRALLFEVERLSRTLELSQRDALGRADLKVLAGDMAASLADELPGSDLTTVDRAVTIDLELLGRSITGLAAAIPVRLGAADRHVAAIAETLAALGHEVARDAAAERITGAVRLHPALLLRAARYLEAAAQAVTGLDEIDDAELQSAFRDNARALRSRAFPGSV